ncbi:MAG: lysophospholipid acyltransferase family protein [Paracoccaceae bacterium]
MIQYIRSVLFIFQVYLMMLLMGIFFAPYAIVSPKGARLACKSYCKWTFWTASWMVGVKGEVRGDIPDGEVIIAAKHQSFFDIMLIFHALPSAKFIMKREILWTPVIGLYAKRLGCVPVNRGKRGAAIQKMVEDVEAGHTLPGQLIIYSQGTRVAPGDHKPYKVGTGVLYEQLGQPCVPVATNVGLFWPRKGIMRYPGTGVVEFLPAVLPGKDRDTFMADLEKQVEDRSNALMKEAGFDPKN